MRRFSGLTSSMVCIFVLLSMLSQAAMAQAGASPGAARKTFDLIVRSEITIDRPAQEVWPYFLDMGAWMSGLRLQNVAGTRGEEGEVRLVKPAAETPYNAYFIKTVRVTPFKQYVVKVMPEQGASYLGFADFSFSEADGKTHVVYDIYVELTVPAMSDEELRKFSDKQYDEARRAVSGNNQNLKSLVEGRVGKQAPLR